MIKNIILSGIALAMLSLFSACQKEVVDNAEQNLLLRAQEETVASSNDFAFRAFQQLSQTEGAHNVFISPLSISMSLGMAYNGADGETKEAMRQTLGFTLSSDAEINQSFKELDAKLKGVDRKVVFTSANSLWHSKRISLKTPFVKTNQTYFDATVQGLDFASPAAKDQMNNWVKSKTNGKIEQVVDEVRHEHVLFLINAIYFKGTWTYPFDKKLTKPEPFHLENGSTITPDFMTMKDGEYLHYQNDQVQLIDLPYGNQQYSMTILVPGRDRTVQEVAQDLSADRLATWLADARKITYALHMPKFKLEYGKELSGMLKQLGMGIAFSNQADFSGMAEDRNNLAISEVKHKTFVEVNEEGTEAAAATSTGMVATSMPPSVRIDRPFVFMIREKSSNAILFIGKLMQPE
ncbi:serpin family protein [Pontibacter sp. JH31]|uniref:Serpin family protein n=1 Tax=Pontibacter aquaedesilientis TaxID=2766980 RepID=A0ABR7XJS4_9BACT|nr:serpin family protein [Pontibacter aquaedesilientis]MBD1398517.1 serpin family protein [Pontibacter aquaedesilientis]